jgi:indolepyruvate decarboxylase
MSKTVIEHVLSRLVEIGVDDIFGVAGDYAFPINDAVCENPQLKWVGCCNELNAGYAADGYARVKGVAALGTTYGAGELSAINAIAGAYADHVPVFHLVGMPKSSVQHWRRIVHHTLADGDFDHFWRMAMPVTCAQAIMTPQNVAYETERLIAAAFYHRRPVYMGFPADFATMPVTVGATPVAASKSDLESLKAATTAVVEALASAETACVLPGIFVARFGLQAELQRLIDASGLPFATMTMDKSVLNERQPAYMGAYSGNLMNEKLGDFVESCDRILSVGNLMSDQNTAAFTAKIDARRDIRIEHHATSVDGVTYPCVEMKDILQALSEQLPRRRHTERIELQSLGAPEGGGDEKISAQALYPRWANFFKPDDIIISETGTSAMGLGNALLPKGAVFFNQTLWGAIGWATPAAFGAAKAAPDRRVVLITGEGSHQLTAQEVSQFGRFGLKPVVFVLNNSGYLIERLLCKDSESYYNDLAPWRYAELPHALGCDWFTARVTTCAELDEALEAAERADSGVYIEVVTDTYAASPLALKVHENVATLYKG